MRASTFTYFHSALINRSDLGDETLEKGVKNPRPKILTQTPPLTPNPTPDSTGPSSAVHTTNKQFRQK